MWIALGIIALAIAMMLGPILIMQPSRRQRRLAQLRAAAAKQGVKVRMAPMPEGTIRAGDSVAVYYRPWPDQKQHRQSWMMARQPFAHGLHFADDWDWVGRGRAAVAWHEPLRRLLPSLPGSVLAVEAGSGSLGLAWLEQTQGKSVDEAVGEISLWLDQLMAAAPVRA